MPTQKDFKRVIRIRMKKTGESYTAARAHLLRKQEPAPRVPEPEAPKPDDYATRAGMSDAALKAKTGCNWEKWVYVLDKVGAVEMKHRDIAEYVHDKYGIDGWWAQAVTVGYERIRGLRDIGQRRGGGYEGSKSKTFDVPIAKLYRAFKDKRMREGWLPNEFAVRTETKEKSMRLTWTDGTIVQIYFTKKGAAKSHVAVQHTKLASKAAASAMKTFWGERLSELGTRLTSR